jgi:hypothetical protein
MALAKFLLVLSTVCLTQVQGQNLPSKCLERPVFKGFDAQRVMIENDRENCGITNDFSIPVNGMTCTDTRTTSLSAVNAPTPTLRSSLMDSR